MNGIEILASNQVVTGYDLSSAAINSMVATFIVCIGIGIYFFIKERDFVDILGMAVAGLFLSIIFGGSVQSITKEPSGYETQYKITISDEVKMNDFYEKYEIVDQDGKIFTVRERQ